MVTIIKGQPTSEQVRATLAAEGRPVLVAFSGGKDAIAAEIALQDAGIETVLAHLYDIPGRIPGRTLDFVEDGLKYAEDKFQKQVHRYPHPSFYRWLNNFVFQPPERCEVIEAAELPTPDFPTMWALIRKDLDMAPDTWVADGVRANDSIIRRASFTKHGVMKPSNHKVSPVCDWSKAEVMAAIAGRGYKLPIDYDWFGRSFDGIDYRFLAPIRDHAPRDFEQILHWFPLADLELFRVEQLKG